MTRYRAYLWAAPLLMVSVLLVAMAFVPGVTGAKSGGFYRQTNLVSDIPGIARVTDPHLVNPWGLSHSPTSPWWVSDNGKGVSTLYQGDGTPFPVGSPLVVTIPPPAGGTSSAPTGNVFNGTGDFVVSEGSASGPSRFIFATEDGTISGWNPTVDPTNAILKVDNSVSGAVYKGLAIGSNPSGNFLYATNFHAGTVDVFDAHFIAATLAAMGSSMSSIPTGTSSSVSLRTVRSTLPGVWPLPPTVLVGSARTCWSAISAMVASMPSTLTQVPSAVNSTINAAIPLRLTACGH